MYHWIRMYWTLSQAVLQCNGQLVRNYACCDAPYTHMAPQRTVICESFPFRRSFGFTFFSFSSSPTQVEEFLLCCLTTSEPADRILRNVAWTTNLWRAPGCRNVRFPIIVSSNMMDMWSDEGGSATLLCDDAIVCWDVSCMALEVEKWVIIERSWSDTGRRRKTEVYGEKPVRVPLCPPIIARGALRVFFLALSRTLYFIRTCFFVLIVLNFFLFSLLTTHNTNIRAPGGIRTRSPSKLVVADSRLRRLGHWDRQSEHGPATDVGPFLGHLRLGPEILYGDRRYKNIQQ